MGVLNRSAIKQEARSFLGADKRWFKMFAAVFIYYILTYAGDIYAFISDRYADFNFGIDYFFDYYDMISHESELVSSFSVFDLIWFLMIPFSVAVAGYFLNQLRGFNPSWKSLYKEGFDNYGKYFAACLLKYFFIFLWSLLFIVPGIIKAFEYSQITYIMHDNKNLKPSQAKKMSAIMTKGYKSKLFLLQISFIGWYLASAFTMGLVSVYFIPYKRTVEAMYYENLKNGAIERGLIAPEAFMSVPPVYDSYQQNGDFSQEQNSFSNQDFSHPADSHNTDGGYILNGELIKKDKNENENGKDLF